MKTIEVIGVNPTDAVRVVDAGDRLEVQLSRSGEHVSNNGVFNYDSASRSEAIRSAHAQARRWAKGIIYESRTR